MLVIACVSKPLHSSQELSRVSDGARDLQCKSAAPAGSSPPSVSKPCTVCISRDHRTLSALCRACALRCCFAVLSDC